ncbi:AraC family transcriptional regulator [Halomonas aestuarii]|uniref:AraC family transcriptional regulator n=1 Tax=Halomonas aestuarii TaxID=1897729 RepID=A0A1J0VH55_9GAMM|nr:AraC family transcriptional regulator N-terminal domain-containing protein [Halomonas aestuarii]APE31371.1 AraC family transcriptional regulator [Halomonas aestuarii]
MPLSPRLKALIDPLIDRDGFTPSAVPSVSLMACHQQVPRTPLMYEPSLVIVVQGRKIGYLGDREIHYDPGQYLVQTLPLPFECETFATPEAPLLGLSVRIDPAMLSELVLETGLDTASRDGEPLPMASVAMTASMQEAVVRLLRALGDPLDARVMGEARVREVIFEALKGEQGPALRALVHHQGHYSQIIQVLAQMHADVTQVASVEGLAREANMSVSSFHQHFKQVTRATPLQYLKRLRLIKARLLLSHDDLNVSQTAQAVGYRSAAQFSRDYKRTFGASPLQDRRHTETAATQRFDQARASAGAP